ncbi:MAG TPA: lamin tail domain-containing protein [Kofleriaceae bacterium]|nr:lamin tail domain-containing protein [Kofleriaceae bacterium]
MSLRTLLSIAIAAAAASSACFSPSFDSCAVECGAGGSCPDGMTCLGDGVCHRSAGEPLCGPRPDADPDRPDADPNQPDAGPPVTPDQPGQLVITEILIDSQASPEEPHEWFELYNPSDTVTYDLLGLQVGDVLFDIFEIDVSVLVPPGGRIVLGESDDLDMNGGVTVAFDWPNGNFDLGNGDDEVILYNPVADVNIDDVVYGVDWDTTGRALSLDPDSENDVDNDDLISWCDATTPFGTDGDLGSPGEPNPQCP